MKVYFTSPILGRVFGFVTTEDRLTYNFKGQNVLISIEIYRNGHSWISPKEQWLHDYQINEIGLQIDEQEKFLSAK